MPDVFEYVAYREFLRDYYREKKAASKGFSFQNFARKAKVGSSGFLLHVMKGERNLTGPVLLNVAQAIGLDKAQTEYFGNLVAFDQAKTQAEKNFHYDRIMAQRQTAQVKKLEDYQYEFFSDWYHAVIRELAPMMREGGLPARLAKTIVPGVTSAQAKGSLKLLEKIGLLQRLADGTYAQSEPFIGGSGAPARKLAITRFQQAMLGVAGQAWDHFPENDISMHTSTLCLSEETARAVKAEMKEFNKRVLALAQGDSRPSERVYHVNLNFFPVTRKVGGQRA